MRLRKYHFCLLLATITILALPLLTTRTRSVHADSGCVGASGAPNVGSVQAACALCGGGGGARGAAWVNNQSTKEQSTIYGSSWDSAVSFTLWGQVYSCTTGTSSGNVYAANVRLLNSAAANRLAGETAAAAPGIALSGTSFFRGTFSGQNAWSSGGSLTGNTLVPSQFFDNPDAQCKDGSTGDRICEREVHVYRCFSTTGAYSTSDRNGNGTADENPGDWALDTACYSDPSTVRMLLKDDDPDTYNNYFYSKSQVHVRGQGDITDRTIITDIDTTGDTYRFSTDQTTVKLDFTHMLEYVNNENMKANDTFEPITTNWKIQQKVSSRKNGVDRAGSYNDSSVTDDGNGIVYPGSNSTEPWTLNDTQVRSSQALSNDGLSNTYTITFDPANNSSDGIPQYYKICQRISYKNKNFRYSSKDQENNNGGYIYEASGRGSGKSEICVRVDYVGGDEDDPLLKREGDVDLSASAGSNVVMLAGETANLSITGKARGIKTRRLIGKRAGVFDYDADADYNSKLNESDPRYNNAILCPKFLAFSPRPNNCYDLKFYSADYNVSDSENPSPDDTEVSSEGSYGDANEKDAGGAVSVAVPDDVGGKYCNAFGWKFRYYYMIKKNGVETWYKEPSKDYFFVPAPACRTIAKKPTTAFWNGSVLMANGSIVMSLAKRNLINGNGPNFGDMWTDTQFQHADGTAITGNIKNLYGSWSEYLAASRSGMDKSTALASGSSISTGAKLETTIDVVCSNKLAPWSTNSSLTISNVGCNLVGAGTNLSSSAFRTRLTAYLEKVDAGSLSGTQIRGSSERDYDIDDNIINSGAYNMRGLPQTIIFAKDVNIAGKVTQIDAWIIATGTIRTCKEFELGTDPGTGTTSDGVGSNGSACANQLVFNGPVVAKDVDLRRTFGADSQAQQTTGLDTNGVLGYSTRASSAEIFNLRADAYLWSYMQAARYNSSYGEVYSRELAPRY